MKNLLINIGVVATFTFVGATGGAFAGIINFGVDSSLSNVYFTNDANDDLGQIVETDFSWWGTTSLSVDLSDDLATMDFFELDHGESHTFEFFSFEITSEAFFAYDDVKVHADLDLNPPGIVSEHTGSGGYWTFFGATISGGSFTWDVPAVTHMLEDGTLISVSLSDVHAMGFGNSATVYATVENLGGTATIPEPSTMLLLGTGLAGIAGLSRRRKK